MPSQKATGTSMRVERIDPILKVRNLRNSLRFYREILGFTVDWQDGGAASVSHGNQAIMLIEGTQGHAGTWVWIGVEDIEPLYRDLVARGATITLRPTNFAWAYELRVADPDGHILRIGSEPKADRLVE
jgi:catechol 2,3-dioxygenase-like lactoylglutathione lyase family enzyme